MRLDEISLEKGYKFGVRLESLDWLASRDTTIPADGLSDIYEVWIDLFDAVRVTEQT